MSVIAICTIGAALCVAAYQLSLKHSVRVSSLRTWHVELAVVAWILTIVGSATGGNWREWLGSGAVLLSFAHAQVSDRFQAREAARTNPGVECHRWSNRYFAAREVAWFAYFATGHCWSALVGCAVFIAYGPWRKWWRTKYPLESV